VGSWSDERHATRVSEQTEVTVTLRISTLMAVVAAAVALAAGCDQSPSVPAGSNATETEARSSQCRDPEGNLLPVAPMNTRVDLGRPAFSDPKSVSNPLFPIGTLSRVILLGEVDGAALRVETTLLPETQIIAWNGKRIETLLSQYVAFLDGRIHEVALDRYAQADDGSVWYFGEDVFNYENGVIADIDGTWLAGKDGPAAMIMPADPRVGDAWRPENICGLVFEEVTATSTGVTVQGPRGPVEGALVVQELHMDGSFEDKIFAPGYGEFSTGAPGSDLEAVALAVPTDAVPGSLPPELETLSLGAAEIFAAAQAEDWDAVVATFSAMNAAWDAFRTDPLPPKLETQMSAALVALGETVDAREAAATRQTAIDAARATLDLELRHRPRAEIDFDLLVLWIRQLLVDAEADDRAAMLGDIATLHWIRDRIADDASPALASIDFELAGLQAAAATQRTSAAITAAARLQGTLARVTEARP